MLKIRRTIAKYGIYNLGLLCADIFLERTLTCAYGLLFRLQCLILRVRCGPKSNVFGLCIIRKHPLSQVRFGRGITLNSSSWRSSTANCSPCKFRTFHPAAKIIIGDRVGMNGTAIVARSKSIQIGNNTIIAPNVTILDSDFHIPWPPERRYNTSENEIDKDVTIHDDVWIGMNTIILKGVTIGKNSIISAGSVVVHDIPENCLAGGVPARVLKRYP